MIASMEQRRVLVFTRTTGYRHESIPAGVRMLESLARTGGFALDAHEDPTAFTIDNLTRYDLVVWLSTSGTVLDTSQREAFDAWLTGGGAFAGIHGAATSEYEWPAFERMLGAVFEDHPPVQPATVVVEDRHHPSMTRLPDRWDRVDEWYSFRTSPRGRVRVLASVDEDSYEGGHMGRDHPIVWCGRYGAGHTWYTALGHTGESFSEPLFTEHVRGGLSSLLFLARQGGTEGYVDSG